MNERRGAMLLQACRDGFSLAETIVGMLVGTVALIALAGVMISASNVQGMTVSRMEMLAIGERQLDQLRLAAANRTQDTLNLVIPVSGTGGSLTSNVTSGASKYFQEITSARGRLYVVRWQVTTGLNNTRSVTVRVTAPTARSTEINQMDFTTLMLIE